MSARTRIALGVAGAALAAAIVARANVSWSHGSYLSYAEGTWCALALDVARGEWYRPVSGPEGYGGTRYWPLVFSVHGLLLRTWSDPVASGLFLSSVSFIAALSAVFALVRALGGSRPHATVALLMFAGAHSAQYGLLAIRGDLLPLALVLGGAALSFRSPPAAALACALAVLGKPTSAYGMVVIAAWYLLAGRRRACAVFVVAAGMALVAGGAALQWLSEGRALPLLFSAATAGGGVPELRDAPVAALRSLQLAPETALVAVAAAAALLQRRSHGTGTSVWRAGLLLTGAAVATVGIFATPGVWLNHFADLHAAAAIVITLSLAQSAGPVRVAWAGIATTAIVAGIVLTAMRAVSTDRTDRMWGYREALAWIDERPGEILADQPMIPVLAGRPVYVVDGFIMRARLAAEPWRADQIVQDLSRRRFAAIVLDADVTALTPDELVRRSEFGARATRALLQHYELDRVVGGRSLLRPREP